MKHCPTCGSSYTDDTLVYCLQDGATLRRASGQSGNPLSMISTLSDDTQRPEGEGFDRTSAPTVEIPSSALPTSLYQEARPTSGPAAASGAAGAGGVGGFSASTTQPSNPTRVIIMTVAVTILLLALGGTGAWLLFRGGTEGRVEGERGETPGDENSNQAAAPATPGAANTTNQSNNQTRGDNRPDKGGRWFVILASFQKDERASADERLESVRRQGFDARIVPSDDYPNFRGGLWLVVMGPYTRNSAEELLEKVRPKIKDAYTKSGW